MPKFLRNGGYVSWRPSRLQAMKHIALLAAVILSGCMSESIGSKTIVGNHFSLPKLSNDSTNTDLEIYESTEGAVVTTRRDCRVKIEYANHYTNNVCYVWQKFGGMKLAVEIEPLAVDVEQPPAEKRPTD